MDEIIKLDNITKTYGDGSKKLVVLQDINLSLNKGEFVTLLGPSGCGKSTLLNLIGLLDTPDSGKILINNVNALDLDEKEKSRLRSKKIGFVFQFDSLLHEFTMLENVEMPGFINGDFKRTKALEILGHLGIKELAGKMPQELSGGEKQRACIARALRNNPSIILADEPTGNLDADNAHIIYNDLKSLTKKGVCVLMVTHNPKTEKYADRVLHLENKTLTAK
ncbi:MAG TPA: ABC transporter ATP-binding protein [Elusimicrobiales bacterium]|nr:ABC transporter ATP-binding protein [Elusimicrobiales bacterium]